MSKPPSIASHISSDNFRSNGNCYNRRITENKFLNILQNKIKKHKQDITSEAACKMKFLGSPRPCLWKGQINCNDNPGKGENTNITN